MVHHDTSRIVRIAGSTLAALLFIAPAGCATRSVDLRVEAPAVHPTVELAALDALEALRSDRHPSRRGRFRVGRILAVPGGFVWENPVRATPGPRPVVRLESGPDHVATFMARGRAAQNPSAALERDWERRERAIVERQDRPDRPLFVLTGRGEVIAYRSTDAQGTSTAVAVND